PAPPPADLADQDRCHPRRVRRSSSFRRRQRRGTGPGPTSPWRPSGGGADDAVLALCQNGGVALEVDGPTLVDAGADALPAGAVAIDVAVLELDTGAVGRLGDEADLDFAGVVVVRLDLPGGADVPAEHDPRRRIERQDARPVALLPIFSAVV